MGALLFAGLVVACAPGLLGAGPDGLSETQAIERARAQVDQAARFIAARSGAYRDVAPAGLTRPDGLSETAQIWVVTFDDDFSICAPTFEAGEEPCETRAGTIDVLLDRASGDFIATYAEADHSP